MPEPTRHIRSIEREGILGFLPTDLPNQPGRTAISDSLTD
jgi:hypothetical protein